MLKNAEDISALTIANDAEDVCASYFSSGVNGTIFQVSFSPDRYHFVRDITMESIPQEDSFNRLFEENRLYYYTGEYDGQTLAWYGYADEDLSGQETPFARYILFT